MVVGTAAPAAGAACRAHDTSGHEGVPVGLVVGRVHLVDGGDGVAASGELHTPASLHFASNKEILRCAENACCKRMFQAFGCFRGTLQLFQMNIAKIDQNVTYVAMVVHECCKGLFSMFHLCFWTYCYKCVYLDVA